jgi:hypothetical protein
MSRRFLVTIGLAAMLLNACANRPHDELRTSTSAMSGTAASIGPAAAAPVRFNEILSGQHALEAIAGSDGPQIPDGRKIIRRGQTTVVVRAVHDGLAKVDQIVRSLGGYTANRSDRQDTFGRRTASVTCLIPAERLDEAIEGLKGVGERKTLTVTADDITTEYFDVASRIRSQTELERRLISLLQRPTNRLSELLEIERELARVRETIDRLEGRRRTWDSQVTFSSLEVTLEEPAPIVKGTGGGPLHTLVQSVRDGAENFVLAIAWIIAVAGSVLPVAMLSGGAVWATLQWRRRRVGVAKPG